VAAEITFSAYFSAAISFSKLASNLTDFASAAVFPDRAAFFSSSSYLSAYSRRPSFFKASLSLRSV